MGERGEELGRGGEYRLPTCRVPEGCGGWERWTLARGGGQVARQHGARSSADRSKWRLSSPEVRWNACRCKEAWGTKEGMRRTCGSAGHRG